MAIPKIEGFDIENMKSLAKVSLMAASKIEVELHVSLLYKNDDGPKEERQAFFFGRTARTSLIPLKQD